MTHLDEKQRIKKAFALYFANRRIERECWRTDGGEGATETLAR
jgi:hypothetical protein